MIFNDFSVKLNEISKFWALNCTKMRLAAGLRPDPLGSYSAPPGSLAVIRGRGGKGGEGKKEDGKGREGREGGRERRREGGERGREWGREGALEPPSKSLATGLYI